MQHPADKKRQERAGEIAAFAKEYAGTEFYLDADFEAAAIEYGRDADKAVHPFAE